nr:AI-2E family transporter [Microbacterium hydrocarbonoxydans]
MSTRRAAGSHVLVVLACATVALVGAWLLRDVIAPLAVALVVVVICSPASSALVRRGWPRGLGVSAIIALAYSVLLVMGALIWVAGVQFAQLLGDLSTDGDLAHVAAQLDSWVAHGPGAASPDVVAVESTVVPALVAVARGIGSAVFGIAVALFLVCAYVVVMAVDAGRYQRASIEFGARKAETIARISRLNTHIRRYYVVNTVFGAIVATLDGLALWWLGVPAPVLWAVLAFVTNFIPNIGFVIGLVPPAILALAVGGWPLLLAVVAVYCVVNVVLQVFVQPAFVSDAVGLSVTLSFFAVVFWTVIIGPVGALLAVPLTLATRALLLEGSDETLWLRWVSGDRTARPAPETSDAHRPRRVPRYSQRVRRWPR